MTVRRATTEDVAELVAMRWEMSVEQGEARVDRASFERECKPFVRDALAGRQWTVWVAEVDGRLAATMWVCRVPRVPWPWRQTSPWGYVTNVFTRPQQRDRGVGSELLKAVADWSREDGLHLLLVWPSERSVPFYARAGFRPTDALELALHPDE